MLILGIESSCDETAAAVVESGWRVRSNVIASQHELHEAYGGVVPEIASRAHVERLLPVVRRAVEESGARLGEIGAIGVGHRPGLIGSLLVGVSAAKALAWSLDVPIVGVDHVQAHLYSGLLSAEGDEGGARSVEFPALGLVVSGGHTSLYRVRSPVDVVKLGGTIDDAIGEAYDKVASILGLGHPGGPRVDALARAGDPRAHRFPTSRLSAESLDFSFSGLKTSVLYRVKGLPGQPAAAGLTEAARADIAASFQKAAVSAVVLKVERALEARSADGGRARTLLVGGGVSANSLLRAELARVAAERGLALRLPAMEFCVDNAAMIAGLAYQRVRAGLVDDLTLTAHPSAAC